MQEVEKSNEWKEFQWCFLLISVYLMQIFFRKGFIHWLLVLFEYNIKDWIFFALFQVLHLLLP